MKIAEFLREGLILPELSATDKSGALAELSITVVTLVLVLAASAVFDL